MITYHYPPDAAVGALRAAKFAKYLPECGWNAFVLTLREEHYQMLDPSRLKDANSKAQVFRTGIWSDPGTLYLSLKKWANPIGRDSQVSEGTTNSLSAASQSLAARAFRSLRRFFLSFLDVAGGKLGWVPPALLKGVLLVRRNRIECLYTTGPMHNAHLVGLLIKKLHGTRWIADFRDPWTLYPQWHIQLPTSLARRIDSWMERQVVEHADKVVSVTDRMRHAFIQKYSEEDNRKFLTIPNGYDPEDFSDLSDSRPSDKFTISHLGTFYLERTPQYFLKAVRELIDEGKLLREDLALRFIGDCRYMKGVSLESMVENEGLSSVTEIVDYVPYRDALRRMVMSHLLLLFAPAQDDQIPGKTFEYLASGADIIAFTSLDSATADVLSETERARVVPHNSLPQIKQAIEATYQKYRTGGYRSSDLYSAQTAVPSYDRKVLTKTLAAILEE